MPNSERRTVDVCNVDDLYAWYQYVDSAIEHLRNVRLYGRSGAAQLVDETDRPAVRQLLDLMDQIINGLQRAVKSVPAHPEDRVDRCRGMQFRIKKGCAVHAALEVYFADIPSLRIFSDSILGRPDRWPELSRALVVNRLKNAKDWQTITNGDPTAYIARLARRIVRVEQLLDSPIRVNKKETKSIKEKDGAAKISSAVPIQWGDRTVEAIEAIAKRAPETAAYLDQLQKGFRHLAAGKRLGWTRAKTDQVRAHLRILAARSNIVRTALRSGSQNVYFETLFEGTHGRAIGTWSHIPLNEPDDKDEIS